MAPSSSGCLGPGPSGDRRTSVVERAERVETRPPAAGSRRIVGVWPSGYVPATGRRVVDDALPAVGNLDPALRDALRRAADAASADVAEFTVNSGWRSAAYQDRLLQDAVVAYGSAEEAARWVASASTSPHVSGDAVDVGMDAAAWLAESGAGFGLCRIYDNEAWHVELRPEAVGAGCPDMYRDPTYDPRMQ